MDKQYRWESAKTRICGELLDTMSFMEQNDLTDSLLYNILKTVYRILENFKED